VIDLEACKAAFHRQRYDTPWGNACKIWEDMARYRAVIEKVRPQLILECGTESGVSARWFAQFANTVSIDVVECPRLESDDRVLIYRRGDSVQNLKEWADGGWLSGPVLVSLDSDHSTAHVLGELEQCGRLVGAQCYLVVEDTVVRFLQDEMKFPFEGNPYDALDIWLPQHPEFELDEEIEGMFPATQHPGGWLRRVQ
jgi:cephalosporin hydroxylase